MADTTSQSKRSPTGFPVSFSFQIVQRTRLARVPKIAAGSVEKLVELKTAGQISLSKVEWAACCGEISSALNG